MAQERITSQLMIQKRVTKGAILYEMPERKQGCPVTSIYLRRDGFPNGQYPGDIQVTITTDVPD